MVVAFVVGRISASESARAHWGTQLQFVQAEGRWHNVEAFREVQAYLEKGCSLSAKEKVAEEIDVNLTLLAMHLQADPDGELAKMLETHDPTLLDQVRGQKVDLNRTWSVSACAPSNLVSSTEEGSE